MKTRTKADYAQAAIDVANGTPCDSEETLLLLGKTPADLADDARYIQPLIHHQQIIAELRAIRQLLQQIEENTNGQ